MKRIIFLATLTGLTILSCKKTSSDSLAPGSLDGRWRMILVKENISGVTITKPTSITGNVDITFTSISPANGTFSGNTPTNQIWQNNYSIGANQTISIPNLDITKVIETSWGNGFVDNIRNTQEYSFEMDGKLNIKTTVKTLTFRKL